jgi:hypothetical protein
MTSQASCEVIVGLGQYQGRFIWQLVGVLET